MSETTHTTANRSAPFAATGVSTTLTHQRGDGAVHMVEVGGKDHTDRRASAEATVVTTPEVLTLLLSGGLPKGEALPLARVAGIMAAKQTAMLIPLCHPLFLSGVEVDFEPQPSSIRIIANVKTNGQTGVEMEALTAVTVAALSLFDMIKAVDRAASITDVRVLAKSGGASGTWERLGA